MKNTLELYNLGFPKKKKKKKSEKQKKNGCRVGRIQKQVPKQTTDLVHLPAYRPCRIKYTAAPHPTTPSSKQVKQVSSPWWFNTFQLERGDHLWKGFYVYSLLQVTKLLCKTRFFPKFKKILVFVLVRICFFSPLFSFFAKQHSNILIVRRT